MAKICANGSPPSLSLSLSLACSQLSDMGFLRFWGHRRLVDNRTGPCAFPTGSHTYSPMSHERAVKGPVRVLAGPYGSALKPTVQGSVRCLKILTGPARAVTTD